MKTTNVVKEPNVLTRFVSIVLLASVFVTSCGGSEVVEPSHETSKVDTFELTRVESSNSIADSEVLTFLCEVIIAKPDSATPNCADFGEAVFDIKWSKWTAMGAEGTGNYSINDCDPDCASGTRNSIPVIVFLNDLYTDGNRYFLRNFSFISKDQSAKLQVNRVWDLADFYINVPEMRADS